MTKTYRKGATGALLDEYEKAVNELKVLIEALSQADYTAIVDKETKDPDCVSVQSILNHVVRAGYGYANSIRKQFGDPFTERKEKYEVSTPAKACGELDIMMVYTEDTLQNKSGLTFEQVMENIIPMPWGQKYDLEQLLEHAIVHVLRHRRQIEIFLSKLEAK